MKEHSENLISINLLPNSIEEQLKVAIYNVNKVSYSSIEFIDSIMPYWVISHVCRGSVITRTGKEHYTAQAGDVMIHPPGLPFSEIASVEGIHEWFMFSLEQGFGLDAFRLNRTSLLIPLQSSLAFSKTFQQLLEVWLNVNIPFRELLASSFALQLIGMVLTSWDSHGAPQRSDDLLTEEDRFIPIITYMNQNLNNKINRDDIADILHLHPRYLDRVFQASYGVTPMQMFRELRIRKIKQALENSSATLEHIASEYGLGDAAYLSRFFLKNTGLTPGQYRDQTRIAKRSYLVNNP